MLIGVQQQQQRKSLSLWFIMMMIVVVMMNASSSPVEAWIPILTHPQQQQRSAAAASLTTIQRRNDQYAVLRQQQQHGSLRKMIMMMVQKNDQMDTTDTEFQSNDTTTPFVTTTTTNNNNNNNNNNIQYIGTMNDQIQQITFIMAFIVLGFGTQLCIHLWYTYGIEQLGTEFFYNIQTYIFPILFGIIFAIVGICHFIFVENFARIVPPYNCWGSIWKVPAPYHIPMNISYEEYHSYWTGIVEFLGGIWLFYTGIMSLSSTIPATILFLLTIGVTPANLYMFTHNATPGGIIPPLQYPFGHIARFIIQCGLLSNFYIIMNPIHT